MSVKITDKAIWANKTLPFLMEYGLYLLVAFLFTDKGESFRSLGLYVPLAALVMLIAITRKVPFEWRDPLFILILLLCLSGVVSSLFSQEPLLSLDEVKKTHFRVMFIFVIAAATFNKSAPLKRMLFLLSLLAVYFTVMTYYDYLTRVLTPDGRIYYEPVRKYSHSLPYVLPFVPFSLIMTENRICKILWAATLFIGIAALLLTGYRGGWASMLASLVIWGVWFSRKRISPRLITSLFGGVATVALVLILLPSSHVAKRFQDGLDTSMRYEWLWTAYVQMYDGFSPLRKLVGQGLTKQGMFASYDKWYLQKTGTYPASAVPRNPHNNYLMVLYQQGLAGFLLYMGVFVVTITVMVRGIWKESMPDYKVMGVAILCPFVGEYLVHGMVEDMRFMPLGVLLGLAGAYVNLTQTSRRDRTG